MLFDILIYAPLLGVVAGVLSGLLGIGGGIIIVPALIYLLPTLTDVNHDNVALVAIATSLATIIVTTFSSARSHYKSGNLDLSFSTPIILSVAVTALVAPYIATWLGGELVKKLFALLLLLLAINMMFTRTVIEERKSPVLLWQSLLGGSLTGLLASIAGLGGGAILVPYLAAIKVNIHKAIAVAAACGMFVAFFGSIGYMINGWGFSSSIDFVGFIHWPTALLIMIFSFLSAPYGVKWGRKLEQKQLKRVFAVFMMLISIELLITL